MSLFGKQLQNRVEKDDRMVGQTLKILGDLIRSNQGNFNVQDSPASENIRQIKMICEYYKVQIPEQIREFDNISEQVDYILQPSGMTKRIVSLNDIWWKNGDGPLLTVYRGTDQMQALMPGRFGGYYYVDAGSGKRVKVTEKNKDLFEAEAFCFYKPLPLKSMTGKDYIRFLLKELSASDIVLIIAVAVLGNVFGMVTPRITQFAFSDLIPSGRTYMLTTLALLLISTAVSIWLMNSVKMAAKDRICNRLDVVAENAVYSRVLHLPAGFFSGKSSGALAQVVSALNLMPQLLTEALFGALLSFVVTLIYIVQVINISPSLFPAALFVYVADLCLFLITYRQEQNMIRAQLKGAGKNNGAVFDYITGIQKIKISGSEKRAFVKWAENYTDKARSTFYFRIPLSIRPQLIAAIHLTGILISYVLAYKNHLPVSQYAAFTSSFGLVTGAIIAMIPSLSNFANIMPVLEIGAPVLAEVPETSAAKKNIQSLSGRIELSNVKFRYENGERMILDGVSLTIRPGEYVAVVGKTGCGKSTLLRLLLGFEKPQSGVIYYDGIDLDTIDKYSLRRQIGTVLQDGKLFSGNIYSNVTVAAPWLTMDDAWEALEKAGMADDVRRMPMGLHTVISEGSGGISGGQKQRLLIARALAPKSSILFLDEATSALDNITQKIVTDSLDSLDCTRIVIAHRLSTIKSCSRIICLDQGHIVEDGTYEELIAKNGFFADLVSRQQIEKEES